MDLNKMGLAPMSELEMNEIDGGGFWAAVFVGACGLAATYATGGLLGEVAIVATVAAYQR